MHFFSLPVIYPRHTVQNRPFPEIRWCFFDDVLDGSSWNIHVNWGFGGFCHRKQVSIERVQSGNLCMEKARKRPAVEHLRTFFRWQGQKDLNPRHAVLETMLKFLSRSNFSPILGICCQPRRWWFKNWCFFDDMLNSAPDYWCSWW